MTTPVADKVIDKATDNDTEFPSPPSAEGLADVLAGGERPAPPSAVAAAAAFGWRSLLKIKYSPEQLFDVTAFPVILTLMFTYLFGGAVAGSVTEYLRYLLPGIMVMSVVMTTMYTGVSINMDISRGVFDRFRTAPIWRPAPMVGYLLADAVRYTLSGAVAVLVGLLLGYRPAGGVLGVLAGMALLVAFSFALSWAWTAIGLVARSDRAVMSLSMLVLFPLTFLSGILVEPRTMPGWLQAFVEINPITQLVAAVRGLMSGAPDAGATGYTLAVAAVLVTVFGALTTRLYNRR